MGPPRRNTDARALRARASVFRVQRIYSKFINDEFSWWFLTQCNKLSIQNCDKSNENFLIPTSFSWYRALKALKNWVGIKIYNQSSWLMIDYKLWLKSIKIDRFDQRILLELVQFLISVDRIERLWCIIIDKILSIFKKKIDKFCSKNHENGKNPRIRVF